ncbi:MAG: adenine deaminase [Anaerolineales bacterium]|nr:MAG: adenine deaminase [Anaerolineales bacterium]
MRLEDLIQVARGEVEADLLLKNARVVNVFSGNIHKADVAIHRTRIVGLGDYRAREVIDLQNQYLCPGFIDGHVHIESSMLPVSEFARVVVPQGTTSIVADPHEISNVLGLDGIRYILESSKYNPLSVYIMLPSCVPATEMETAGSKLTAEDLAAMWRSDWVLGLGEVMNYPGVIFRDWQVLNKIKVAADRPIDGHAPGLSGRDLCAYVAAGIRSDHEATTAEEAREKLQLGMHIMIREGTTARDLEALLPVVTPSNSSRCMFVTDDRHLADLLNEGHMNFVIRKAISLGLVPMTAIQMATINPARYFGLKDKGGIGPGMRADVVVLDDLDGLNVQMVIRGGQLVARGGQLLPLTDKPRDVPLRSSMNINWERTGDLQLPVAGTKVKVIGLIPDQILTESLLEEAKVEGGFAVADVARDILKMAVIERHLASGNMGLGFVKGFGLKRGALGSSVAHDSHNLVLLGTNDEDMMIAARRIERMRGGLAVVADGHVVVSLPLSIAGLMSERPYEEVSENLQSLLDAAHDLGSELHDPFMTLSFLALPVIPALKLTDRGLVDVTQFKFVPLFED